jgi:hypothetical protein
VLRNSAGGIGHTELGLLKDRLIARQDLIDGQLAFERLRWVVRGAAKAVARLDSCIDP